MSKPPVRPELHQLSQTQPQLISAPVAGRFTGQPQPGQTSYQHQLDCGPFGNYPVGTGYLPMPQRFMISPNPSQFANGQLAIGNYMHQGYPQQYVAAPGSPSPVFLAPGTYQHFYLPPQDAPPADCASSQKNSSASRYGLQTQSAHQMYSSPAGVNALMMTGNPMAAIAMIPGAPNQPTTVLSATEYSARFTWTKHITELPPAKQFIGGTKIYPSARVSATPARSAINVRGLRVQTSTQQ